MKRRLNPEPRWLTELIRRMDVDGDRREERDKAGLPEWLRRGMGNRAKTGTKLDFKGTIRAPKRT
jgi:hypothetical protein